MPGRSGRLAVVAAALSEDVRAAAKLAREAGFEGMQLDARVGDLDVPSLSQSGRRELLSVLRGSNIELVGMRADLGKKGFAAAANIEPALDAMDRIMEVAAGLRAPLVCVDIGPVPEPVVEEKAEPSITSERAGAILVDVGLVTRPAPRASAPAEKREPFDAALGAQVDGALAELGRRADRRGVSLALRSELSTFAALHRALNAVSCQWFGVDLDPVALLRDRWEWDEVFSRLGTMIRHGRGRDAILGADRRTKAAAIGEGSVEWERLLASLDECGRELWITVDPMELPNRRAAAAIGAARLRNILAG